MSEAEPKAGTVYVALDYSGRTVGVVEVRDVKSQAWGRSTSRQVVFEAVVAIYKDGRRAGWQVIEGERRRRLGVAKFWKEFREYT